MLKRKLLGEVRKGLAQLAAYHHRPGHQLPTFYEGLRFVGENAEGPVRVQLTEGRPSSLPLGVGRSRSRSRASRMVLSAFCASSIRPRERPSWYLSPSDFGFEVGEPLWGFWRR